MDSDLDKGYIAFDWNVVENKDHWLDPCEESYYYAQKWRREGRMSLLDLGCGLGRHTVLFAKCGFKVTATDISKDALDFLKKYRREQGVDIACRMADMEKLPFADDAFDCIFAMHSAGHADTKGMKRVMNEIRRVLKPDGSVFMTLCSKETWTYAQSGLPKVDENTIIKTQGSEQGVPHFFVDQDDITKLFADFELVKVRHIDDCYNGGKWKDEKHYFIEAVIRKQAKKLDYSSVIGKKVDCKIDRPLGSVHPRHPDLHYPVNYGYVPGIIAGDGAEQDVYILGIDEPLKEFSGIVTAVYHRLNDNEDKWIVTAEGAEFTPEEILAKIEFQEKFFDGELYQSGDAGNRGDGSVIGPENRDFRRNKLGFCPEINRRTVPMIAEINRRTVPMIAIIEGVKDAGEIMLNARRPKIMEKSGHANFCTETDEKIQAFLIGRLKEVFPEAEFLGEEDGQDVFSSKMSSGYCFVIDPIDGTSNFIYEYRPSVISVGLLKDGKPYMAVVYNPYDELVFSAIAGQGAYMNGEKIMSSEAPLKDSLSVFGTAPYYTELQDRTFDIAKKLLPLCVDLRRSGTAAWDMCCVAMGRCSLYFELKIQLWDYAAAALIAREAGCMVTDIDGKELSYTGATSVLCRARGVKEIPECFS